MKCVNCGKEIENRNKKYCSQKCRTAFLRNYRTCIVCGKEFYAKPSSNVKTCSRECEYINRSNNGRSEKNMEQLRKAWDAINTNPNAGQFDTNVHAKSWGLMSPDGKVHEVNNLAKWYRDNVDKLNLPYSTSQNGARNFVTEICKVKRGKAKTAGGWTLVWWSDENHAREGMEYPHVSPKRTKMTEEERLERKRIRAKETYVKRERTIKLKYKIEAGIENAVSLTTVKRFSNSKELRKYINSIPADVWFVVEYNSGQWIVRRNFSAKGRVEYNDFIKCPKALEGIE